MQLSKSKARRGTSAKVWCHIAMFLTVVAWGVSFVSTKVLLDNNLTPADIYIYRFLTAYLIVFFICFLNNDRLRSNTWTDEFLFLLCGLCGSSIYYLAENTALEYTLTSNVSLITTLSPLFTALILGALYRSERPTAGMLGGSAIAILGVACVIFNSSFVIKMNPLGDVLSLGAAVSFSIYTVLLRRLNAFYSVMFISRKTFFYGLLTGGAFMIFQNGSAQLASLSSLPVWGNLAFLGVVCSLVAFSVLAEATKHLGAVTANNYIYFQPIVTLVASALILGEKVTIVGIIGCALILIGVILAEKLNVRKPLAPRP